MESVSDRLRVKRRSAKGKFARQVRTVEAMILNTRSHSEVYINWEILQRLYEELQDRHDAFTETIDSKDDAMYDEEEDWIEKCRETYVNVSMSVTDYIRNIRSKECTVHNDISCLNKGVDTAITNRDQNVNKSITGNPSKLETGYEEKSTANNDTDNHTSTFKLEFNQMPKFSGDVREYATFRSDFKDLIEPKCSKRDAITLLRNNLFEKPYELIKGIGNDYTAAWEYLDSVYGDQRVVADAITYDITSFRALQEDEDSRFCELCHLVRRSFNTLKDIGRQADLDNNHMLAIIEQKMYRDDRKIWSRKVEENKIPATLEQLLNWMTIEMKSRMRASALIREEPSPVSRVHCVSSREYNNGPRSYADMSYRCWICRSSTHWVDECEQFRSIPPAQRVDMVKKNNACVCCLKRTGKNHTSNSCFRRRQCMESNGQDACKLYHHPLLHTVSCDAGLVGVAGTACNGVMLPVFGAYIQGDSNKWKLGSVLLDSGAQISLIRTRVADELGLSGKDVTIAMNKVGGDEETLKTKRYKLSLHSMDSKNTVNIHAIGIPYITDDISSITNVSKTAREMKIPVKDIHRRSGPVDVLVGTDHPQLHTGQTKAAGNVVARRSPLGWVLFGTDGQISVSSRVLTVQISKPVHFSDCGKTKVMHEGVGDYIHEADETSCVDGHAEQLIDESTCVNDVNQRILYPRKRSSHGIPDKIRPIETLVSTEKKTNRDNNIERELPIDRMNDSHSQKLSGSDILPDCSDNLNTDRERNMPTSSGKNAATRKRKLNTRNNIIFKSAQNVPEVQSVTQITGARVLETDNHKSCQVGVDRVAEANIPEYTDSKHDLNLETERLSDIKCKRHCDTDVLITPKVAMQRHCPVTHNSLGEIQQKRKTGPVSADLLTYKCYDGDSMQVELRIDKVIQITNTCHTIATDTEVKRRVWAVLRDPINFACFKQPFIVIIVPRVNGYNDAYMDSMCKGSSSRSRTYMNLSMVPESPITEFAACTIAFQDTFVAGGNENVRIVTVNTVTTENYCNVPVGLIYRSEQYSKSSGGPENDSTNILNNDVAFKSQRQS